MQPENLEESLTDLPEQVAKTLEDWRMKTLQREMVEAKLYLKYKADGEKRTSDEIKARIKDDGERFAAVLVEIKAESQYNFVYEKLLCAKKKASLRTAF